MPARKKGCDRCQENFPLRSNRFPTHHLGPLRRAQFIFNREPDITGGSDVAIQWPRPVIPYPSPAYRMDAGSCAISDVTVLLYKFLHCAFGTEYGSNFVLADGGSRSVRNLYT